MLKVLLPRLAEGFSIQRGAIFGFGPNSNDETGTLLKVSSASEAKRQKLNKAPIHNVSEERSVGFINYELSIRGKRFLESASKKMVLNKSIDILEQSNPNDFKKFIKPSKEVKEIKLEWADKVKQQKTEAFSEKEKASLSEESKKYSLLETLKKESIPGPFTSEEEIKNFLETDLDDKLKNKRMYDEVKYARITCMSLKRTAAVFRLRRNHRNLSTEEYAENLISYLSTARCCSQITIGDLRNVMYGIMGKNHQDETHTPELESSLEEPVPKNKTCVVGEHVIAFWHEGNETKWHLGVVEKIQPLTVSYMTRTDQSGHNWTFPERSEIIQTAIDQVIATKIKVQYLGTVRIRCKIVSNEIVQLANNAIKDCSI